MCRLGRKKLERYGAMQSGVLGFVNDAHPAATEFFYDAIVRNRAADQGLGVHYLAAILGRTSGQVNVGKPNIPRTAYAAQERPISHVRKDAYKA